VIRIGYIAHPKISTYMQSNPQDGTDEDVE